MLDPTLLAGVPVHLQEAFQAGKIERVGVLLHDVSSKRIVGHYQPSAELSRQIAEVARAGGPASSVAGLSAESLQLLGAVGSAASVLNLAVSVGGFALVLNRLKRLDGKMDTVLDKLSEVQTRIDRRYKIAVITAAERSEEAFHASPDSQRRVWTEAEATFDEALTHFYYDVVGATLVEASDASGDDSKTPLYGRLELQESLSLIDWLTFCGRGRIEALYLLGEPDRAAKFADRLAGWLSRFEVRPDAYVEHVLGGRVVSHSLRSAVRADGESALQTVTGWRAYAEHTRESAATLHAHKIDTNQFVRETRDYPEPALLYLPLDDFGRDTPDIGKSVGRSGMRT